MIKKIIASLVVAAIVLFAVITVVNRSHTISGGTTNFDAIGLTDGFTNTGSTTASGGLSIGSSGTNIGKILTGTMNCQTAATTTSTYLATTTTSLDCSVTGALVNDKVFVTLASTTPISLVLSSAYASSAADWIRVAIFNASTSAITIGTNSTSTLRYLIIR